MGPIGILIDKAHQVRNLSRNNPILSLETGVDRDTNSMVRAIETMLLSHGCQHLAAIISPEVPKPNPVSFHEDFLAAHWDWHIETQEKEALRMTALEEFVKTIKIVRAYALFPPSRVRDGLKTEIVSRKIQNHYGAAVPLYSVRLEHVARLQDLVEQKIKQKSEMEVMKELKMANGL